MLQISKDANINYLAKVVVIKDLKKHPNADRLNVAIIDFQEVIIGPDTKVGDVCIFFPLESQINHEFLSHTNSFRHSNLNKIVNDEKTGFFEDKGRVRAVKLRGQKSMGVLFPLATVEDFAGKFDWKENEEFDTVNGILILKKFFVPIKQVPNTRLGHKPRISRLVEGQVHLHVDTENLRKNMDRINPEDYISITYKVHGTSFWASNVLVKRKLKLYEKIAKVLGVKVKDTEYDYVYGSRKVVKNEYETSHKEHFYEYDLWAEIKDELKDSIPKGYTIYGECLGYTKGGKFIQQQYDYACERGEKKIMVYRITFTNEDGFVINLSTQQTKEYCERYNLTYVPLFYFGLAGEKYKMKGKRENWKAEFITRLEKEYNDKDCYICKNKVPEEGIVLRKESPFQFETYKLKSYRFLEFETKLLDEGVEDMESSQ